MHDLLKVRVTFVTSHRQEGAAKEVLNGIMVRNQTDSETLYNAAWSDINRITPTAVNKELKKLTNENLKWYINQAQGFYLNNDWYSVRKATVGSRPGTHPYVPEVSGIWEGQCIHCGNTGRVRTYNELPYCRSCILVFENKNKRNL